MKIYLRLPSEAEFHFETAPRKPLDSGRFEALCWLAAGALVALVLVVLIIS